MVRFAARRAVHRGLGVLGVMGVLSLVFVSAAGASVFAATTTANQSTFSSATLQLSATTGANNCYSTGTGAGAR